MKDNILDGKKIANEIHEEIAREVEQRKAEGKKIPHLAAVLVGDDGASQTYVNGKIRACKKVGFEYTLLNFPASISEEKLLAQVDRINQDED